MVGGYLPGKQLPHITRGLCCWALMLWLPGLRWLLRQGKVAGFWARPPRCQRQFLPETGKNKRAVRDRLNYEAGIKRLLIACPWTSVYCVIAIYRNMLSGTLLKCVCIWFDYSVSWLRFARSALPIQWRWLESPENQFPFQFWCMVSA